MDDDDIDYTEGSTEVTVVPSRPMSRLDLLIHGIWIGQTALALGSSWLEATNDLLMMHSNHRSDRSAMAEQAALEIETLTGGDSDG